MQFVEAAEQVVSSVGGGGSEGGGGGGRNLAHLFSMPWRASTDAGTAEQSRLRGFVESFVRMEFLPAVYVDFRCGAGSGQGCWHRRAQVGW